MNPARDRRRRALPRVGHLLFLVLVAALALTGGARGVGAQATPYVFVLDPAYQDLNLLASAGLVRHIIMGERPYSEAAFHRFVEEAKRRIANHPESPAIHEALERLERRFGSPESGYWHHLRAAPARFDLTGADSPYQPLVSHFEGTASATTLPGTSVKGTLDPLLQNNEGRILENGLTAAAEGGLDAQWGHVAGEVIPRLYLGAPSGGGPRAAVQMINAYARVVFGPVAVDAGRNNVVLGSGAYGGPLLSENPPGMDMIRLAADRPVRLPGFLSRLGLWQASISMADLGKHRDVPYAKQFVMRLSARPSQYVELGLNYTNMQGGTGSPRGSLYQRIQDLLFPWTCGGCIQLSDKVAGADLRVAVPQLHAAWYTNFATTDDRGHFTQPAQGYWNDAVWLSGVRVTNLGAQGRWGARLEWSHTGPNIYTHWQFKSGQTLDGRLFGDALGPGAWQILAQTDRTGSESRLMLTAAWERYSGNLYKVALIPGEGPWAYKWYRIAVHPPQIRQRIIADYTRFQKWHGLEPWFELGLEHVTRFNYTGPSRFDVMAQVSLRYRW